MGFAFFEQDGTFNPADYGLKVGDMIAVVMIGGGGSAVNAGTASSFGDYLTAEGGLAAGSTSYAGDGGWHPSLPMTMCKALPNTYNSDAVVFSNAGGVVTSSGSAPTIMYGGGVGTKKDLNGTSRADTQTIRGRDGNWFGKGGKTSIVYGCATDSVIGTIYSGGGGSGYGAGGAGGICLGTVRSGNNWIAAYYSLNGGSAGEYITNTLQLKDLNQIDVVVGTGGASEKITYTGNYSTPYIEYGAGEDGCVAVYW